MFASRSCARCLAPLPDLPPGGGCPFCGARARPAETPRAADTPPSTSPGPDTPAHAPSTPTPRTPAPDDPFAPTATAAGVLATAVLNPAAHRAGRVPVLANYDVLGVVG